MHIHAESVVRHLRLRRRLMERRNTAQQLTETIRLATAAEKTWIITEYPYRESQCCQV